VRVGKAQFKPARFVDCGKGSESNICTSTTFRGFLKNVMIPFSAVIWCWNRHFFSNCFGENVLKIITSTPGIVCTLITIEKLSKGMNTTNYQYFATTSNHFGWVYLTLFDQHCLSDSVWSTLFDRHCPTLFVRNCSTDSVWSTVCTTVFDRHGSSVSVW
jgi:hypothetical protein